MTRRRQPVEDEAEERALDRLAGTTTFPNELVEPAPPKRPEWLEYVEKQGEDPGPYPEERRRRR